MAQAASAARSMVPLAELNLGLHPKQSLALDSEATEILYGGAAFGGKSHLMRVAMILWCVSIPGLQCYLFRRIRDDLVKNHMEGPKGLRSLLAGWVLCGFVSIVEDEIRFWNGSKIYLCHCKDEKDIYKYQGAEIHVLVIDELTHFTEKMYRFLRNRVRMVGITLPDEYRERFPRILSGSNPGNIGHLWVKATFIDSAQEMEIWRTPANQGGMKRQYIKALLEDNPSGLQDDPEYESRLQGLGSKALVNAMRYGDWSVVEGAYFDNWDAARHVIRPIALPAHWTRFRSMDWGYAKPFSVNWFAVSDGELPQFPKGALIMYREWYGCTEPNVGLRLDAEELARGVLEREADDPKPIGVKHPIGYADPSMFAEDGGPSIAERMQVVGCWWARADNKRIPGWDQVRARLTGEDDLGSGDRPMLYIFETCRHLIRTLPALQHDEDKPEDLETDNSEDHAADSARYGVMSRPYMRAKPAPKPPVWKNLNEMTFDELHAAQGGKRRSRV